MPRSSWQTGIYHKTRIIVTLREGDFLEIDSLIFQPLVLPSILSRPLIHCLVYESVLPQSLYSSYEVIEDDIMDSCPDPSVGCALICIVAKKASPKVIDWFSKVMPLSVPVLIASESFEAIEACMRYGVDDFYIGPLTSPLFLQRINALIRGSHLKTRDDPLNLAFMAYYDSLTGLLNRTRFESELNRCCRSGLDFALLYLDLDGFKAINDQYGHDTGDWILRQVSSRLKQIVKKTDLISRMGGDEFAFLLDGAFSHKDLKHLGHRLISCASSPYHWRQHILSIGASIGAVRYPQDGSNMMDLLARADQMMYMAKKLGKNNIQIWV